MQYTLLLTWNVFDIIAPCDQRYCTKRKNVFRQVVFLPFLALSFFIIHFSSTLLFFTQPKRQA